MLKVGILGVGTIAKILVTALDQKEVEAQLVTIWIRIASEQKQFLSDFRVVRRWCLNRGRNLNLSAVSKPGAGQAANLRHNMLSTFRGARVVLRLGPRGGQPCRRVPLPGQDSICGESSRPRDGDL
jgi:hypothetical protein